MRTLIFAMACAAVLALSGVSQAAEISTPPIYGSIAQVNAHCVVLNGMTIPLAVTLKIINSVGSTVATSNCTLVDGKLGPGQFCPLSIAINGFGGAYACNATAESVTALRGTLVLEEEVADPEWPSSPFFRPIRSAPMR